MSNTVFFKVSDTQNNEIESFMRREGYTNKAEFFRFLLKFFKYSRDPELEKFNTLTDEISDSLIQLDKKGFKFKSIKEQLKNV